MFALPQHIDALCFNFVSALSAVRENENAQLTLLTLRHWVRRHLQMAVTQPQTVNEIIREWSQKSEAVLDERLNRDSGADTRDYFSAIAALQAIRDAMLAIISDVDVSHHKMQRLVSSVLNKEELVIISNLRLPIFEAQQLVYKVEEVKCFADKIKERKWLSPHDQEFSIRFGDKLLVFERVHRGRPCLVFIFRDFASVKTDAIAGDTGTQ